MGPGFIKAGLAEIGQDKSGSVRTGQVETDGSPRMSGSNKSGWWDHHEIS